MSSDYVYSNHRVYKTRNIFKLTSKIKYSNFTRFKRLRSEKRYGIKKLKACSWYIFKSSMIETKSTVLIYFSHDMLAMPIDYSCYRLNSDLVKKNEIHHCN